MTEKDVLSALQAAVIAAVAASENPSLPIKMLGRTMKPPSNGKWLEVRYIPNNYDRHIGGEPFYRGLFRLILHWPINDEGVYEPLELLESVGQYFHKGRNLSGVIISETPTFMGVIDDTPPDILFPLNIRYMT